MLGLYTVCMATVEKLYADCLVSRYFSILTVYQPYIDKI